MKKSLCVLCIHGVGGHPVDGAWEKEWARSIKQSLTINNGDIEVRIAYVHYDDLLAKRKIRWYDVIEALGKLLGSGLGSVFRGQTRGSGGIKGIGAKIKFTAGMVVKWVEDKGFRKETRDRLATAIRKENPDVICAHSLGSLICYDCFTTKTTKDLIKDRVFITFGSQIANPFVQGNFSGGKIVHLDQARYWFHLYNKHDDVFASPIHMQRPNFAQIETHFDDPGVADHAATSYLSHANTIDSVWSEISLSTNKAAVFALEPMPEKSNRRVVRWAMPKKQRALLIGINDYADPQMRLDGCVNDVFLMSSMLQEVGIEAENIRVLLDRRATASAIRDRLKWLLDGCQDGDKRFLYFSGHGAQIPGYGIGEVIDRRDESLVAWDFDWSRENAIVDDDFYELYSQLDYAADFTAVFDCCHSAGLTRTGSQKVRGINPPDDIRHRAMEYCADSWEARFLPVQNNESLQHINKEANVPKEFANEQSTHKLGQAAILRPEDKHLTDVRAKELGHRGPYMPTLMYACMEHQYAYEYRHGSTSYGAFTYSLVNHIKALNRANKSQSPQKILEAVKKSVHDLRFPQEPQLIAPSAVREKPVKWLG